MNLAGNVTTSEDDLQSRQHLGSGPSRRLLRTLVVVVSIFVMLLFVVTALRRLRYRYELEQLEGYMFLSALRVFHGQSLYPRPSLEFIPYMYPPGYYYACAALGKLTGMSIATMRMMSILSTLGGFAAIYWLVWSEVRRHIPAIAAAGLYAGCYVVCEEWFDLGRLDSFFVLLVLMSIYATRRWHPAIAAGLWILSFQTKQSILPVAIVMLCCDWRNVRRTVIGITTLLVGVAGSVAWLNHATRDWYSFYVFSVPRANSDIKLRTLVVFWPTNMLRPLMLPLIVIVAAALLTRISLGSRATRFYLATCSVVPVYWWIDAHAGSTANALMPIYAILAVLFGIAIARLLAWLPTLDARLAQRGTLLLLLAVLGQEVAGVYNPGDYVPAVEVKNSLAAVVATVQGISGEVYISQPYYSWLAGKPTYADLVSIHDAMRPTQWPTHKDLLEEWEIALTQHRFAAFVLDDPTAAKTIDTMAASGPSWHSYYNVQQPVPGAAPGTRPDWLMVHLQPRPEFSGGDR